MNNPSDADDYGKEPPPENPAAPPPSPSLPLNSATDPLQDNPLLSPGSTPNSAAARGDKGKTDKDASSSTPHAITRFISHDPTELDSGAFDLSGEFIAPATPTTPFLGDYQLLEKIGAGGMGEVYRAEHKMMHRQVALKILPKSLSANQNLVDRFYAEVRAVARLMHPNIVTAFDAGQAEGIHYLVMELIDGDVLSRRIAENGPLSGSDAVEILRQAATALDYAHRLGITHRDIKPSNMMMNRQGVLKILDFGLAQIGEAVEAAQSQQKLIGTIEFMSPEQISRPDTVDHRSDLYSLGASLFYLLTGKLMFSGEPMQIAQGHLRQKPPALYEMRSDIDLRLDAVFQKLVAKNPDERLRSGKELLETLERLNLITWNGSTQAAAAKVLLPNLAADNLTNPGTSITRMTKATGAFAIDLGMAYSSVAVYDRHEGPRIVPLPGGSELLRNMIWNNENQIYIGADAVARRQAAPEKIFHGLQRWLGLPQLDRPFGGRIVPPEVPVAVLLRHLADAATMIQQASTHAVITIPSCYDQLRRYSVVNACRIAGIQVLQLLDRPLAAALAWLDLSTRLGGSQRRRDAEENWMIIHAGASGIEVALVAVRGLEIKHLATAGDWLRGTHRWQHLIAEHLCSQFMNRYGRDIRQDLSSATRLQRTVELSLDRLAETSKVDIRFESQQQSIQCTLTRRELMAIAEEPCMMLQQYMESVMKQAGVDPFDIDQVLWMGSLAKIDDIRHLVDRFLAHSPPSVLQSKTDLAIGAAIQSQHMMPTIESPTGLPKAISAATYDLGLLAKDSRAGKMVPKIFVPRGSQLPFNIQRNMRPPPNADLPPYVQIIEGTSLGDSTWHKLGSIDLKTAFPGRPMQDPCQLRLKVDDSGLWSGTVGWPNGQQMVNIPVTSEAPMTTDQVDRWKSWLETLMLCSASNP